MRREPALQFSPWQKRMPMASCPAIAVRSCASIHHDGGALAAAFQNDLLEVRFREYLRKYRPTSPDPVKTHAIDVMVPPDSLACGFAEAGNDIECTRRESRFDANSASRMQVKLVCSQLYDDRVAARQRRCEFPHRYEDREIPGSTAPTTPIGSRTIIATTSDWVGAIDRTFCRSLQHANARSRCYPADPPRVRLKWACRSPALPSGQLIEILSMRSAHFSSTFLRCFGGIRDHTPESKTRRPDRAARSTSSAAPSATCASVAPVAGLMPETYGPTPRGHACRR